MSTTVVVRRVAATPARSAAEAWEVIADLVAPQGSATRQELDQVAGITMSLIAAEAMRGSPIVVIGRGPRVRIYCLYDDEAILGEGTSEDSLAWRLDDNEWTMSLPCPPEDLTWVQPELARVSTHITARDMTETGPPAELPQDESQAKTGPNTINREAFLRS
jgi:hypothetical protein